jgi:hypothetical protein
MPGVSRPAAGKGSYCRFGGGVNAESRHSRGARCGGRHDDRPAVRHQRQRLLNGEQRTFHIRIESLIELLFGNSADRSEAARAGIRVDDVVPAFFAFDLCEKIVQVIENVAVDPFLQLTIRRGATFLAAVYSNESSPQRRVKGTKNGCTSDSQRA